MNELNDYEKEISLEIKHLQVFNFYIAFLLENIVVILLSFNELTIQVFIFSLLENKIVQAIYRKLKFFLII